MSDAIKIIRQHPWLCAAEAAVLVATLAVLWAGTWLAHAIIQGGA